ncbi:MAG: carbohydrate ABC transporter permease [Gaiellaceae bacterium MAG52_C11]|nr:carbohydrate ABC transporter permease [Candidatus Gaiellasilicea maunaloa]
MATVAEPVREPVVIDESVATRILRVLRRAPVHVALAVIGVLWLMPTIGLLFTSLLTPSDAQAAGWWQVFSKPSIVTFENYANIFQDDGIVSSLWVTAQVTLGATILPILVASLAGYAFAWLEFPGRDWIFLGVVALLVVPLQMSLIPIFELYNKTGLFDTIIGLVFFHSAFALPFGIFLLRNFFAGIPRDLLEAARIDGASELRIFARVVLPLGIPAIASLGIFQVLFVWNDLLIGLVLAQDNQPIAPEIFSQLRQFGANLEIIAPAAFFSALVPLTIFAMFQRYFVEGLLAGSVK